MEDIELQNMWNADTTKTDQAYVMNLQAWALHARTIEYIQTFKAETTLRSLVAFKRNAVIIGIIWSFLLAFLIYGNQFKNFFFSGSLSAILLFSIVAVVVYIRQIVLIKSINYGERVVDIQEKLLKLQISTVKIIRLGWLQLPFYTSFYWSKEWIENSPAFWYTAFPITLVFILLAIWIYRHINFKNMDKKWFGKLIGKKEWSPIIAARASLDEIAAFKRSF